MNTNKRLYKSDEPIFAGVCGGIAEYFEIDPTLIRILAVILCLAGFGFPVIAYIIAMIIMPKHSVDYAEYIDVKPASMGQSQQYSTYNTTAQYPTNQNTDTFGQTRSGSVESDCAKAASSAEYVPPGRAYTSANPQAYDVCWPNDQGAAERGGSMRRRVRMSIIFGILLVSIGVLALLATFFNIIFLNFWPMLIIVWGLIILCTPRKMGWSLSRAGNAIVLITVGFVLQLWALGFFNFGTFGRAFISLWPVLFVVIGLVIIGNATRKSVFKLFGSLLLSIALLFGVWSFGQMQSYTLTIPLPWSQNRPLSINTAASPNSGEAGEDNKSQGFIPKPTLVPNGSANSNSSD